jgi:hypothetical protein
MTASNDWSERTNKTQVCIQQFIYDMIRTNVCPWLFATLMKAREARSIRRVVFEELFMNNK